MKRIPCFYKFNEKRWHLSYMVLVVTLSVSSFSLVAAPAISGETIEFNQVNTKARVTYDLTGGKAVITLDIQTNTLEDASGEWVSIGGENVQTLSGDVNKIVEPGSRAIIWQSRKDWPEHRVDAKRIRAVVTAWNPNQPPNYLVIGLDKENDVRFYAESDFIPFGIYSDHYKTNDILMRKIPAAGVVWRMGSYEGEDSNRDVTEVLHLVMLTTDYYMGVYELTQGQLMKFYTHVSRFDGYGDSQMRPANNLNIDILRGWGDAYWPHGGYETVKEDSVIDKLRDMCGLTKIDLPTEAQWEFACRAGTSTAFNNGKGSATVGTTCEGLDEYGWYVWNSTVDGTKQPHAVGGWPANDFGLYDMHGNVAELCLGRWSENLNKALTLPDGFGGNGNCLVVDPEGAPSEANAKMLTKGGAYERACGQCRSAARILFDFDKEVPNIGCRLCVQAQF